MKNALALFLTLFAFEFAHAQTCAQLQAVYKADRMNKADRECAAGDSACEKLKAAQLREAAVILSGLTAEEVVKMTDKELDSEFDPIYSRVLAGPYSYDVVNIDMGDNSFLTFFKAGTLTDAGIRVLDGSIEVAGDWCDLEFEPYMSDAHRLAVCQQVVPIVNAKTPDTRFDMAVCMSAVPDKKTGNVTTFYVEEFDETEVGFSVQRNFHDLGGGYFSCGGYLNRKTSVVRDLSCDVR